MLVVIALLCLTATVDSFSRSFHGSTFNKVNRRLATTLRMTSTEAEAKDTPIVAEEDITSREIVRLEKKIEELRANINSTITARAAVDEEYKKLEEEFGDEIRRVKKEFARMKERAIEESTDATNAARANAVKEILPISDNYARARGLFTPTETENEEKILTSYDNIFKEFQKVLEDFGIQRVECVGKPFDYTFMEAIMTAGSTEYPQDVVTMEYQDSERRAEKRNESWRRSRQRIKCGVYRDLYSDRAMATLNEESLSLLEKKPEEKKFKRNLEAYELLSLRKMYQAEKYKQKATSKVSTNTAVDVTCTVESIDYIDPIDGSFKAKFKLHAIYEFDAEKQAKNEDADPSKDKEKGERGSVKSDPVGAMDEDEALAEVVGDSNEIDELEDDLRRVGIVNRHKYEENIFFKLLHKRETRPDGTHHTTIKRAQPVKVDGEQAYYRAYNLDEDEVKIFMKYYNLPVMRVVNVKGRETGETIEWDDGVRITLYHEADGKYSTRGAISIMSIREYEFYFKEIFELYLFPFDLQDLSLELAIDEGESFDIEINDFRFRKAALEADEWEILEPNVKWNNPASSEVSLRARRKSSYYIQNVVTLMYLLTSLALVAFGNDIDDRSGRVSIVLTLVLTVVAFKFVLSSTLPKISYNTLLDYYVNFCTLVLASYCLAVIVPYQVENYYTTDDGNTANDRAFWICFSLINGGTFFWAIICSIVLALTPGFWHARVIPYDPLEDSDEMYDYEVSYVDGPEDRDYCRIGTVKKRESLDIAVIPKSDKKKEGGGGLGGRAARSLFSDSASKAVEASVRVVDIIHFNDVYNLDPAFKEEPIGGASRFCSYLEDIKLKLSKENKTPLILFSGDFVGPSLLSSVTQGAHMIDVFNHIGVHYGTFGNHEVDYGYESLKARLDGVDDDVTDGEIGFIDYPHSTTTWLSTNMTEADTGLPFGGAKVARTALFNWGGGRNGENPVKVGLIGVSENWLKGCTQLRTGEILYEDYIQSARNAAISLRAQGAEIVLAITHNRLDNDYALTKAVPEIDLLLGGHDHFYKEDLPARIIKSGEEWRWVSYVQVSLKPAAKKPVVKLHRYDVKRAVKIDPFVDALVKKYRILAGKKFNRVIFQSAIDLNPTEESVRFKESALANWICDACAEDYSMQDGYQTADIAMICGFHFAGKAIIHAGGFTLGHLMSIFPLPLTVVVLKLSGEDVVKSLTLGAQNLPKECGGLHHVSSRLRYTIKLPQAALLSGKVKVENVMFDDEPIKPKQIYTVAVTDAMAKGNFGYTWMKSAERVVEEEFAAQIQDLVIMYCKRNINDPLLNPANPSTGRITIVPFEKKTSEREKISSESKKEAAK